ncbi:MAG: glycoside hydrolase family 13 protein, partial [Clostridia bacterium]|nr:glycoside hydrolase family 13 protein [Clostridia bacterium]
MIFQITEHKFSKHYNCDMSLFGAFPGSDTLRLEIKVPRSFGTYYAEMQIYADALDFPDDELKYIPLEWSSIENGSDVYSAVLNLETLTDGNAAKGLFYYRYKISGAETEIFAGGEEPVELKECGEAGDRQLLIFDDGYQTSSHLKEGIIYHIFVDRFRKSGKCRVRGDAFINPDWDNGIPQYAEYPGAPLKNNMFFGGDLWGVIEKLDYIASLGAKTIYLSPVFEAASNHKYDTGDYLSVDSMFGGDEALKALFEKAEERGISVILDGVFNHTGSDSIYFNREGNYKGKGAYNSQKSPYYDWYSFTDYPDEYECWWNFNTLPNVDETNSAYNNYINGRGGIIQKWLAAGASGWRLDVADELPDEFIDNLSQSAKQQKQDALILGEVWEDASNKTAYGIRRRYLLGGQLDSVMNYPFRDAILGFLTGANTHDMMEIILSVLENYPPQVIRLLMNHIGTHDTERAITMLAGEPMNFRGREWQWDKKMTPEQWHIGMKKLRLASLMQFTLPGVPCIYYGDEAGVEGYRDPFNRTAFPWGKENMELLGWYE